MQKSNFIFLNFPPFCNSTHIQMILFLDCLCNSLSSQSLVSCNLCFGLYKTKSSHDLGHQHNISPLEGVRVEGLLILPRNVIIGGVARNSPSKRTCCLSFIVKPNCLEGKMTGGEIYMTISGRIRDNGFGG